MNFTRVKRLAFFLPTLSGGGAERVTVNLLTVLARMGVPLDLVLVEAKGPYLSDVPESVRVIDLKCPRVIASVPRLTRYLKQESPAALVSAMAQANVAALLARRLSGGGTKMVVVDHSTLTKASTQSSSFRQRLMPFFARQCYHWADGVAAVSHGVADDLAKATGLRRENIQVFYNPVVRNELFSRATETVVHPWIEDHRAQYSRPLIISVGRLSRPKDYPTLIRAFARLKKRRDAWLIILGEGEERRALETLVRELNLNDCVSLPGFVDNPYAYMARAQLFVLSSQREGLPTVLIEALALGVPVVSTDCESGPREILDNGKYGPLVSVGDSAGLACAMESVLDTGQIHVPQEAWTAFSEDAATDKYLQFIKSL